MPERTNDAAKGRRECRRALSSNAEISALALRSTASRRLAARMASRRFMAFTYNRNGLQPVPRLYNAYAIMAELSERVKSSLGMQEQYLNLHAGILMRAGSSLGAALVRGNKLIAVGCPIIAR